jgi:hypothetical protein
MTTICGHERDALIWALTSTERYPAFVAGLLEPSPGLPVYTRRVLREWLAPQREAALRAIHDSAKLAEIAAEEGRRLGLDVVVGNSSTEAKTYWDFSGPTQRAIFFNIELSLVVGDVLQWARLDMSQARAALLRVMLLPEGAPIAEVLKALEVPR